MLTAVAESGSTSNSRMVWLAPEDIAEIEGDAMLRLNRPIPREVVLQLNKPWEGNISTYMSIIREPGMYRLYYRAGHFDDGLLGTGRPIETEKICIAESDDGIIWNRPELGQVEFHGSKVNNILHIPGGYTHCFVPFRDDNPDVPTDQRYKAVSGREGISKLWAYVSADGINWRLLQEEPVLDVAARGFKGLAFDSQNVVFFDAESGRYHLYFRLWYNNMRSIMHSESSDFITWEDPELLNLNCRFTRQLYTNVIMPYPRVPGLLLGFPSRYNEEHSVPGNLMDGLSDTGFMSSRDGINFRLWDEGFISGGRNREAWYNRNLMVVWNGLLETSGTFGEPEFSLYATENYFEGDAVRLRRYTLRPDGFCSVYAPATGGRFTTHPVKFEVVPDNALKPVPQVSPVKTVDVNGGGFWGKKAFDARQLTALDLPGTRELGSEFTLSTTADVSKPRIHHLFSAFNSSSYNRTDEPLMLMLLYNPGNPAQALFYFWYGPMARCEFRGVELAKKLSEKKVHHFGLTYDHGCMKLFLDGQVVAETEAPDPGPIQLKLGNLRFGGDYPPRTPQRFNFVGVADDIMVARRALSVEEMHTVAEIGAEAALDCPNESGLLYTMEGVHDSDGGLEDFFTADGNQPASGIAVPWGNTMLLLNASTSAMGKIRVELRDENDKPIPGYTLEECDPIHGDELERPVSWNGRADVSELAGKYIRIHFELDDAEIFSCSFGQPTASGIDKQMNQHE